MELKGTHITGSPREKGRVRLSGEVIYESGTAGSDVYWFDVPREYAESLSTSGNPWLTCLLPLAVTVGEPLRICRRVDQVLFENAQELMRIWKCWYPHLHVVPIEAELHNAEEHRAISKTAAFFSGGVDSFFTVLRHDSAPASARGILVDDLLLVWGFDIRLDNSRAFSRMHATLQRAASDLGKELIDVATNLRSTRFQEADWGGLSHGSALASAALAMEKRNRRVLIASTHGYKDLQPWGSHPLTDPLLSTSRTKVVHDGAAFDRIEKTGFLAQSEVAMRSLHVCWMLHSDENCGACSKCYRTMTTLSLLGALERCTTFRENSFDERKIAKIYSGDENDRSFLREIRRLAVQKGRLDIARAIDRSFKHSARFDRSEPIIKWLKANRLGCLLDVARKPYRIWLDALWRIDRRCGNRPAGRE